jgi:hypothetical protein
MAAILEAIGDIGGAEDIRRQERELLDAGTKYTYLESRKNHRTGPS